MIFFYESNAAHSTRARILGPWIATAIVIGTVIGSGVFKKGRNVAENVPEFGMAMAVWVLWWFVDTAGSLPLSRK